MSNIGFDNDLYMQLQYDAIEKRISSSSNKLYLEFGGKLFDDYHASRVLPGFDPNIKTKLLLKFKDKAEVIFCINANDLEKNKIRADFGINYGADVLRLIDNLRSVDIFINSVVITMYNGQHAANIFKSKLEQRGEKVYIHTKTAGYPTDVKTIVSEEGYGKNPYIETTRPLVVVTAPGPGSGKLATCLCQLYHEHQRGICAGYAKFETFPIWNIPLKHPVNIAYEAATVDLNDVNMIDSFHFEAYGKITVNYNRDIEMFPVLKTILETIQGTSRYNSPTDMGVNMAGLAICDDEACRVASKQEIIRRYYAIICDYKQGKVNSDIVNKMEMLMSELGLTTSDRPVVKAALQKESQSGSPSMAIQLADGSIITGRNNGTMSAPASCVLNAIKSICKMNDKIKLIAPSVLQPILSLKTQYLGSTKQCLNLQEVLLALSISATMNPSAEIAMSSLTCLKECEAHSSTMLSEDDSVILRRLKVHLTSEPKYSNNNLYN